jgi:SAM-dependent methyltransferase
MSAEVYDAQYYDTGCGEVPYRNREVWLAHFRGVVTQAIQPLTPRPHTVFDAGCAFGYFVEALREAGYDARGADISEYAISQADPAVRDHVRVGGVTELPGRHVDLITCIEVLEHVDAVTSDAAIANFCAHSDAVLFSSSPVDETTESHVNVRPPHAWAECFARHGFWRDLSADVSSAAPWAALFRKRAQPVTWQEYEDRLTSVYGHSASRNSQLAAALREKFESDLRVIALERESEVLRAERDHLAALVHGYKNGRVMRALTKVTQIRNALSGKGNA